MPSLDRAKGLVKVEGGAGEGERGPARVRDPVDQSIGVEDLEH